MSVLKILVIQCSEEFEIIACFLGGIFVYNIQYKNVETVQNAFV
jgi:hypothetical protein